MVRPYMETTRMLERDLKRGSTEMLIMAIVEERPRHGYEIGKLIEQRSDGVLQFHIASLYPLLYRLEKRGLIKGRWIEKPGERRRRFYTLTAAGRKILAEQRRTWKDFFAALDRVAGINPAGADAIMPDFKKQVRERLAHLRLSPTREAEIAEELAQHLEATYEE